MDPAPDLNIIDRFLAAFSQYIDSGFGLLGGDVAFLTTILIGLDITLAGLWWAMDADKDVLGRFLKKILYVGIFAFILGNFQQLGDIVFRSFAGLGLTAGGGTIGPDDLLKPGKLAAVGFDAAKPMLTAIKDMLGFPAFFGNALSILVLFVAWLVVVLAFFILAIQLFLTIIEFKLTTLAGFVLVPFALFNKTSFLAERVLGNVVSSGLKVMVLAVIVGIGGGFFEMFLSAGTGEPDVASAMTLVLAALSLLGLAIFGPGVASGLVSGAPQLGAGAAVGTVAGAALLGAGGAALGARALGAAASGGMASLRAGTAMGSAARASYQLGQNAAGKSTIGAGASGVARAAAGALRQGARNAGSRLSQPFRESAQRGQDAAWNAMNSARPAGSASGAAVPGGSAGAHAHTSSAPAWAQRMRSEQASRHRRHMIAQAVKDGDRPGAPANPDLSQKDD